MLKVMTKFKVNDFTKWQASFKDGEGMRMDAGSKGVQVFQSVEDPNTVTIIMDWDDKEKAMAFSRSPELREAQQKSGVISIPEIFVLQAM